MEITITILSGVILALLSAIGGHYIGAKNGVKNSVCGERRENCTKLIMEKLEHLKESIEDLCEQIKSLKTFAL
jgi:hypothetical protein